MPIDGAIPSNSGATNEERLAAMREIQQIGRRRDELNGEYRAALKRWKTAGVALKPMLAAIRASKLDYAEVRQEMRETAHMMALRGIIELATDGQQSDFLSGLDVRVSDSAKTKDNEWAADDRGYRDGKNGVPYDENPYLAGTEAGQIWAKAWHDGQAAAVAVMGEKTKQANASRARPERTEDEDNVVPLDAAKGGKGKGKGKGAKGGKKDQKPGGTRKAVNGSNGAMLALTDESKPKRGRPTKAMLAERAAAAEAQEVEHETTESAESTDQESDHPFA